MAEGPRLSHIGALDGLRGAAVLAVIVFHGGHFKGGYLGVDLFFVLSGFLITSLLLAESASNGRVSLARFWERRARRLLPALLVMLAGVAAYARFGASKEDLHRIRWDGIATIFYVANWRDVFAKFDYWALFNTPSPFDHTWSLAIEEQFYLVWPLAFTALLLLTRRVRRRSDRSGEASDGGRSLSYAVLATALVLGAVSAGLALWLYQVDGANRVYFGTDTRAFAILAGVALAAANRLVGPIRERWQRVGLEVVGLAAAGWLALTWTLLDGNSPHLYRGGLLACSAAGALVIAAAIQPTKGPIAQLASLPPLRWAGLISYGVYLYHWPLFVWLTADRVHLSGWPLFGVRCAATLAVALASYFLVEQPVRHGVRLAPRAKLAVPSVSLVAVGLLLVGTTVGYRPPPTSNERTLRAELHHAVLATKAQPTAPRLMVVGNSVAWFLGHDGFQELAPEFHLSVLNASVVACTFPDVAETTDLTGKPTAEWAKRCTDSWKQEVDTFRPDVVLFARNGVPADKMLPAGGSWLTPCSPAWTTWYRAALRRAVDVLTARGATLVFATTPYSAHWLYDRHYDRTMAANDCGNAAMRAVAASSGGRAKVVDTFVWLCKAKVSCKEELNGVKLRPDGVHFRGEGAHIYARWLFPQLGLASTHRSS